MMNVRLQELLQKKKSPEHESGAESQENAADLLYKRHGRKVLFADEVKASQASCAVPVMPLLREAALCNLLSAPLTWFCLLPLALLGQVVSCCRALCLPIYGILQVRRGVRIIMNRSRINSLNSREKINCACCSCLIGGIAFLQEVAGRTEQYWCPIKHARRIGSRHNRYAKLFEYGDAEGCRQQGCATILLTCNPLAGGSM